MFCKKGVLKNFVNLTGKNLCRSLFSYAGLSRSATLLKKRLRHRCFPVNFVKFIKTPFYWRPPVAVSSNFKATGFTEAVMQMNFKISHDLLHLNILSSTWHFCVYFRECKLSFYISTALWLRKYDIFYFSPDNTIEVSRDFFGGAPYILSQHPTKFWGPWALWMWRQKVFDLSRDHVNDVSHDHNIDVSRGLVGGFPLFKSPIG